MQNDYEYIKKQVWSNTEMFINLRSKLKPNSYKKLDKFRQKHHRNSVVRVVVVFVFCSRHKNACWEKINRYYDYD